MLKSLSTIANINVAEEAKIMIKTVDLFNNLEIHIGCDTHIANMAKNWQLSHCKLHIHRILPDDLSKAKHSNKFWLTLMKYKMEIMKTAIETSGDTLLCDSDMIFFNEITDFELEKYDVALSQHFIRIQDENKFGKWNGGYVGSSRKDFPVWWSKASETSKFFDQGCLELVPANFKHQELPITHNFGWWRINQTDSDIEKRKRLNKFKVIGNNILYDQNPLISIHTHIKSKQKMYDVTNSLVIKLLTLSDNQKHKTILNII